MQGVVGAALRQRVLVVILSLALVIGGVFAYAKLNIEAYPDPVPPLVDIVTQNPWPVVGGDRALHHHPHRSADGGTAVRDLGAHDLAHRPLAT
jgi:hypothetical protein